MNDWSARVLPSSQVRAVREALHAAGEKLVFTNGCFDILHRGHVTYLTFARAQGDALCVGLNRDASVRRKKGPDRPINAEQDRAYVLGSIRAADFVVIFDGTEPRGTYRRDSAPRASEGSRLGTLCQWPRYRRGARRQGRSRRPGGGALHQQCHRARASGLRAKDTEAMSAPTIVTGAAGFIGRNVVAELNTRGITDLLLVDKQTRARASAGL